MNTINISQLSPSIVAPVYLGYPGIDDLAFGADGNVDNVGTDTVVEFPSQTKSSSLWSDFTVVYDNIEAPQAAEVEDPQHVLLQDPLFRSAYQYVLAKEDGIPINFGVSDFLEGEQGLLFDKMIEGAFTFLNTQTDFNTNALHTRLKGMLAGSVTSLTDAPQFIPIKNRPKDFGAYVASFELAKVSIIEKVGLFPNAKLLACHVGEIAKKLTSLDSHLATQKPVNELRFPLLAPFIRVDISLDPENILLSDTPIEYLSYMLAKKVAEEVQWDVSVVDTKKTDRWLLRELKDAFKRFKSVFGLGKIEMTQDIWEYLLLLKSPEKIAFAIGFINKDQPSTDVPEKLLPYYNEGRIYRMAADHNPLSEMAQYYLPTIAMQCYLAGFSHVVHNTFFENIIEAGVLFTFFYTGDQASCMFRGYQHSPSGWLSRKSQAVYAYMALSLNAYLSTSHVPLLASLGLAASLSWAAQVAAKKSHLDDQILALRYGPKFKEILNKPSRLQLLLSRLRNRKNGGSKSSKEDE